MQIMSYVFPKAQLKTIASTVSYVLLFVVLVLSYILFLHFNYQISLYELTTDFAAVVKAPVYTALLSQMGIFFWAGSAAICLLSGALLSKNSSWRNYRSFFFASAGISLMLGLDDVFLFHEEVFPNLGVPQKVVYLTYALAMLVYGFRYLKLLLKTDYVLFAVAIGCFGLSIFIDIFVRDQSEYISNLLEDGIKFAGIVFWTSYYFRVSTQLFKPFIPKELF